MIPGTMEALERTLSQHGSVSLTPQLSGKAQWTIAVGGAPVGWVTLDVTSRDHHIGSIGYTVDPRYHGHGLASAAVRQVVGIALDPNAIALERVEAVAAVENRASRRVLEKCGFRYEGVAAGYLIISGVRVDHARYARLRSWNDEPDQ